MKPLVRISILLILMLLFSSCEWLNQAQLFPREITIMEDNLDLSDKLGIYEVWDDESPFEMLYLESYDRKLIFINSLHSSEGAPNALIIDAESLDILQEFNNHLSLFNLQPGLIYPGTGVDNEFYGTTSLRENLENIWINIVFADNSDLHWDTLLFLLDTAGATEKSYAFEVINQENIDGTIAFPSAQSLELNGQILFETGTNGTDSWIERRLTDSPDSLSIPFSGTFHPAGAVNDLEAGKSFFYGFSPVDINSYGDYGMNSQVQVNATFRIYEVNPSGPSLIRNLELEGSSDYCWYRMDNMQSIHKADLHYTRKGWVMKKDGKKGFAYYYLHDPGTGLLLNQDPLQATNALAACFDFSGEHYYYIDQRSLKLIKAVTPW